MMSPSIASTPAKIWNGGRGGAKHKPAPALDSSLLATCFGKHKEMIGNMGAYESIGKSMSPLGPDLMKMLPLLKDIVAMSPSATLPPGPSKHALINMLLTTPRLNPGPYNSVVWASARWDRLGTVLYHLRKIKREPTKLRAVAGADRFDGSACAGA